MTFVFQLACGSCGYLRYASGWSFPWARCVRPGKLIALHEEDVESKRTKSDKSASIEETSRLLLELAESGEPSIDVQTRRHWSGVQRRRDVLPV